MFRKSFITLLFLGAVVMLQCSAAFAQAPVSGTVELQKPDGTREPVPDALIEVYRTDIKAGHPSAKTNKRGAFTFVSMPFGGTFVFSVSAPNCAPTIFPNVKAGQDKLLITLFPGGGNKLTEEEVRKGAVASAGKPGEAPISKEEQAKRDAEFAAETKKVLEKNANAEKTNTIVARAIKEGNEAYNAANYDLAISKYDEGLAADPEFVGSAPIFLNNRGTALRFRAIDSYNKSIKLTDVNAKVAGLNTVKKDFADAAAGFVRSWNLMKNAPPEDVGDKARFEAEKLSALRGARDTFQMAVKTEQIDPALIESAKVLIPEYLTIEADAAKKAEVSLVFADMYRITQDRENSIAAYKKVLETYPDNLDALAGAGLVLVDLGWIKDNDKVLSQEGANYLQKFVSLAPDTHKLKIGAVEYLNILKTQSIIPVKQAPTKKKN
jgi:tetratricopeptide (TPR) repeat protein